MSEDHDLLQARLRRQVNTRDTGEELPATAAALAISDPVERLVALVAALADERVIAGALVGQAGDGPCHRTVVEGEGDDELTCAFTSAEHLSHYDPKARPVPLSGAEAAQLALRHTGGRLLINATPIPGEIDGTVRLPRPACLALAAHLPWMPAWEDPNLREHLKTLRSKAVVSVRCLPTASPTQVVRVGIAANSNEREIAAGLATVSGDSLLRDACEAIELQPVLVTEG